MGVGTQVVTVVGVGLVKVTVVQISVPTQASAVPHPVAAVSRLEGRPVSEWPEEITGE